MTLKFLLLSLSITLLSCATTPTTLTNKYPELNNYLSVISEKEKAMGELLFLEEGKVVYKNTYGFLDQKINSIYRVGSITKTYTAVLIMKLVESGQLSLNTKINIFFPEIPNSNMITVEHLLRHRSGLVNFTSDEIYQKILPNQQTRKDMIQLFVKLGTEFNPDEKFKYSNTGYVLLSYILEDIHKQNFSEVLKKEITQPNGLANTFLYKKEAPQVNEVISYQLSDKWAPNTNTHQNVPLGAGSIASTTEELSRFLWLLFNNKLLSKTSTDLMKTIVDGYGLGLFKVPYNKKFGFGHTGGIDGFRSQAFYFEEDNFIIVNLTNALDFPVNDLLLASLNGYYGNKINIPEFPDKIKLPSPILKSYVGLYKSKELPLDITISIKNDTLFAQGSGQPAIPVTPITKVDFINQAFGAKFTFNSSVNEMVLSQGGKKFNFKRVKN